MENIADMVAEYDAKKGNISKSALRSLVKELRKSKLRRPDIVYDNWEQLLVSESGNEVWNLYEQLCAASLDYGDVKLANECVVLLLKQFPDSARVGRLLGLLKEQCGEYEEALEIYKGLLAKNPANLMVLKRKVCVHKAMGDTKSEIEEINNVLKQYPGESSSWQELGDIYLGMCDYTSAAHCFEELVLLSPTSAPHHVRLADVYYTIGNFESLLLARKHYSISLTHQAPLHNLRAIYGVIYACNSIDSTASTVTGKSQEEIDYQIKVNNEMLSWAKEQLQQLSISSSSSSIQAVCACIL
mmetsp:Transcript_2320/g.3655  ORF Transcript_2320/g.3655 Transcript_2320/m.3655 type:complete len:300 (+) Transcript_2320:107-1006(+)